VKYLVLDEFDQLLNDTIIKDVQTIVKHLPKDRNTLFFSATINKEIHTNDFFKQFQSKKNLVLLDYSTAGDNEIKTVKELKQHYILVPNNTKEHYLVYLLQNDFKGKYIIIFVSSCKQCHYLTLLLELFKLKVSSIHSKIPQRKRFQAIEKFKARVSNILIATDIASRGLDIPTVEIVINFNIPQDPDDYIHRVGRTARAGRSGEAFSFVTQYDVEKILAIEEFVKEKLVEYNVESEPITSDLTLVAKAIKLVHMVINILK
jgi:superfamily II DNA/RNA helicase